MIRLLCAHRICCIWPVVLALALVLSLASVSSTSEKQSQGVGRSLATGKQASSNSPQAPQSGPSALSKFAIAELEPRISLYLPERDIILKTSHEPKKTMREIHVIPKMEPGSSEQSAITTFEMALSAEPFLVTASLWSRKGAYSAVSLLKFVEVGSYKNGVGAHAYLGLCPKIASGLLDVRQADDYPAFIQSDDGIMLSAGTCESDIGFTVTGSSDGFVSFFMECDGVTHLYVSKAEPWKGFTFEGDETYPLTFKKVKGRGYVYLCGRGTVTLKDGKTIRLGDADTVEAWLSECNSADALRKEGAAQALGYLAKSQAEKKEAASALIPLLKDDSLEVRRNAAEALGNLGDAEAIEPLTALLGKTDAAWDLKSTRKGMGTCDFRYTKCDNSWVADVASEALAKLGKGEKPGKTPN